MAVSLNHRRQLLKIDVYISCDYTLHEKAKTVTKSVVLRWAMVSVDGI